MDVEEQIAEYAKNYKKKHELELANMNRDRVRAYRERHKNTTTRIGDMVDRLYHFYNFDTN